MHMDDQQRYCFFMRNFWCANFPIGESKFWAVPWHSGTNGDAFDACRRYAGTPVPQPLVNVINNLLRLND